MSALQKAHLKAYENAKHLIESGVPLFLAPRSAEFPNGGSGGCGYHLPSQWQKTKTDISVLDEWTEGTALCAVMGHAVDGLDRDPRNGGEIPDYLNPVSYGRQSTPSGGTHDLIGPLGTRSLDGVLPGVDVKSGVATIGHGFLFLSPTEKVSKTTGEVTRYQWLVDPDLTPLTLVGGDHSGQALAELIHSGRRWKSGSGYEYNGPTYSELTDEQREQADLYVQNHIFEWKVKLGDASGWDETERDHKGRGWESLAYQAAWAVAKMAACPWTGLSESDAEDTYLDLLPDVIASNPKCKGKWYDGLIEKVSAQTVDLPPWWENTLLETTPVLRHIRDAAHSRLTSPSGLLALVLGRILLEIPPSVLLPPVVGSAACLNLGVAIVAGSGGGKSSSINISQELLGLTGLGQDGLEHGLGSGEGMVDLFLEEELAQNAKGELKPTGKAILSSDPRALIICDEVEQMEAMGSGRSGSSLNPILRDALTGDPLKMSNAKAGGRSRRVPKRSYRAIIVIGVQPGRSDVLLSEVQVDVGTPQRFVWCQATDPERPKDGRPDWPGPLDWKPPTDWPDEIDYPGHIKDQIVQARERFLDGLAGPSDGHLMLTQLKVAFAIAVLHGETKITDQWWDLASVLMNRSREIQNECRGVLMEAADRREVHRATRQAKAVEAATEVVSVSRLRKAAESVIRKIEKAPGEEFSWRQAKPAFRLREGLETEEILEEIKELSKNVEITEVSTSGDSWFKLRYVV